MHIVYIISVIIFPTSKTHEPPSCIYYILLVALYYIESIIYGIPHLVDVSLAQSIRMIVCDYHIYYDTTIQLSLMKYNINFTSYSSHALNRYEIVKTHKP